MMFGFGRLSPSHALTWNPIQKGGWEEEFPAAMRMGQWFSKPLDFFQLRGTVGVWVACDRCGRRKSYVAWKVRRVEWDLKCVFADFWEAKNGSVTIMNFKRILANYMEFDVFFLGLWRSLNQSSPPGGLSPMVSTCTPFLMGLTCDEQICPIWGCHIWRQNHITAALNHPPLGLSWKERHWWPSNTLMAFSPIFRPIQDPSCWLFLHN